MIAETVEVESNRLGPGDRLAPFPPFTFSASISPVPILYQREAPSIHITMDGPARDWSLRR